MAESQPVAPKRAQAAVKHVFTSGRPPWFDVHGELKVWLADNSIVSLGAWLDLAGLVDWHRRGVFFPPPPAFFSRSSFKPQRRMRSLSALLAALQAARLQLLTILSRSGAISLCFFVRLAVFCLSNIKAVS